MTTPATAAPPKKEKEKKFRDMVQPKENALQYGAECHSENGRLDWSALGYFGDPIEWGGRE